MTTRLPCHYFFAGVSGLVLFLLLSCPRTSLANDSAIFRHRPLHHLRIEGPREWTDFDDTPDGARLELKFSATENSAPATLRVRQQDVKQNWNVTLNDQPLGKLQIDENDMACYYPIPVGAILTGQNTLTIEQPQRGQPAIDDIRVGDIVIDSRPITELLNDGHVEVEVVDAVSGETLPARITIVTIDGALQSTGATSNEQLAVRPGLVFTSTGKARIGLPAGNYTIYAGRGFEYSLDSHNINITAGKSVQQRFTIQREVPTEGYVACDPHIHTLTHSGHGDATVQERMITLAAEGIELAVATDHNVNIDHRPFAEAQGVNRFFTTVIGNEVTTAVGHFNIFPVAKGAPSPNHQLTDWKSIFDAIHRVPDVRVAILNHGRDLHSGVRPLGPKLHNEVVGENLDDWPAGMNAMEVINSSATQNDPLQLTHDWMAFLNRGRSITPIGSSDSHDVGRHFVGQGRTYVRCDDRDPGNIDVRSAVDSLIAGRVLVSYGLLVELTVNGKYASGDLARVADQLVVDAKVLGPHWVVATRVQLFANGHLIRTEEIPRNADHTRPTGVLWEGQWTIDSPPHDVHLVAIATGPGIDHPYWKTAKPYQPTSPDWIPQVLACSGAVWLDVDGDGRPTSAFDYATRLFAEFGGDLTKLLPALSQFDRAVAAQAAHLYQTSGKSWLAAEAQSELNQAAAETQAGVRMYIEAWRASQLARADSP